MAHNTTLSNAFVTAMMQAGIDLMNAGTVKIYSGTQPANPNVAITDQVLLGTLTLPNPAFVSNVNGVAAAGTIGDSVGVANGTATWCRCATSGGAAEVDGSVGAAGADLNLSTGTTITNGGPISVSSLVWTQRKTAA